LEYFLAIELDDLTEKKYNKILKTGINDL